MTQNGSMLLLIHGSARWALMTASETSSISQTQYITVGLCDGSLLGCRLAVLGELVARGWQLLTVQPCPTSPFHRALRPRPQKHDKLYSTFTVFELLWLEGSKLKFLLNYLLHNPMALRPLSPIWSRRKKIKIEVITTRRKLLSISGTSTIEKPCSIHLSCHMHPMLQHCRCPCPTAGSAPASNRTAQRRLQVLQRKQHSPSESLNKGTTFYFLQIDNFET